MSVKTPNVGSLMLFQLATRLLTFIMNTIVIRYTSPTVLGLSSVKLELFMNTVLYLARDGVRMALVRYPPMDKKKRQSRKEWMRGFINTSWLSIFIGSFVSILLTGVYLRWPPTEIASDPIVYSQFIISVAIYILSSLLELVVEPIIAWMVFQQQSKRRMAIEMQSLIVRIAVVIGYFFKRSNDENDIFAGLKAFSYGQLAKSMVIVVGYIKVYKSEFKDIRLSEYFSIGSLDNTTSVHAIEMTKQLFLKYILAQGDMWVVSTFCKAADQGVYSVVINYGSLVCRLLFQPLEESGLVYFSKSKSKEAYNRLAVILKFYTFLSLICILVVPWYTEIMVRILLGSTWSESSMPFVLAAYCFQIPALAFCGILESFMNATITKEWFNRTRIASFLFSLTYLGLVVPLVRSFNSIGLIIAGVLSFGLRAILGLVYLHSRRDFPWSSICLGLTTIIAVFVAAILSMIAYVNGNIVYAVPITGAILAITLLLDREFLNDIKITLFGS